MSSTLCLPASPAAHSKPLPTPSAPPPQVQGVIEAGPHAALPAFLAALERLEAAIDFLQAHRSMHSAQDALRHTTALRDAALASAAAEFAAQLQKRSAAPTTATAPGAPPPLPEPVAAQLRSLAAAMLRRGGSAAGGRACVQAYASARCGALAAALDAHLPPQQASSSSKEEMARLPWEAVEPRIPGWTAALRLLVQLAQAEAQLCGAIFPAGEQGAVAAQVVAAAATPLLEAAEVVLSVRRSPDKVPALLEMHAALEAALAPLRAALAGGSRLQRASMGSEQQPALVAQLAQVRESV